jgi:hypothetical protein
MILLRFRSLFFALAAGTVTPSFGQIFWSNQSPAGLTDDVSCATFANGTFAAVTSQGRVLTSIDGLTWSSQTVTQGTLLTSIAYGNGAWVAAGAGGLVLESTDLKTWVTAKQVTNNQLNCVSYVGLWMAVGNNATVITSPDGLNWTVQTVPASTGVTGFLNGITLLPLPNFGLQPPYILITGALTGNGSGPVDTGIFLEMATTPTTPGSQNYPISLQYKSGAGSASYGNLEGIQSVLQPGNEDIYDFVAVGWQGSILSGGNNSPILNTMSAIPNVTYRGITYGNGYWVAAGDQGTILSSSDGLTWTQRFSGSGPSTVSTANLLSATYSATLQRYVVTGTGGTILLSNGSRTDFGNVSTRGSVSSTQTFIGGFVIEGTDLRTVLIRGDGPSLGTFGVSAPLPDPVLTVYNSGGVAIATNSGWTTNSNPTAVSAAALQVGAFPLPNPSLDSALLLTLQPGAYTAQITSAKGNTGIVLFEAYTD